MDKSLSLPPSVRGRVTGFLIFFVDEIIIYNKTLSLSEKLDLVLQVQWWGETLPAYIRPKQLQEDSKFNEKSSSDTYHDHFIKYEIKTTPNLFLLYLKTCEIIELCVVKKSRNYICGSAFLNNLSNILNKNKEIIKIPVFDYSGEEIGEVVIRFNFVEIFNQDIKESSSKTTQSIKSSNSRENNQREVLFNKKLIPDYLTLKEKTIYYDGGLKTPVEKFSTEAKSPERFTNKEDLFLSEMPVISKTAEDSLPEIKVLKDSSKILSFCSNRNLKSVSKFNSNSVKFKSKTAVKEKSNTNNFKNYSNLSKLETDEQSDLQNIPSKDSSNKVLDYLLGSDMNRIDEESALNDFKNMSPSHTLVDSISQLCLHSNTSKTASTKSLLSLNFDFSNPIERNYYEKFFLEPHSNDFEIAQFLNEPKNNTQTHKLSSNSSDSDNFIKTNLNKNQTKPDCARCKYYKKLDELDTIIESLKHFEQKMIAQEKDSLAFVKNSVDKSKKDS